MTIRLLRWYTILTCKSHSNLYLLLFIVTAIFAVVPISEPSIVATDQSTSIFRSLKSIDLDGGLSAKLQIARSESLGIDCSLRHSIETDSFYEVRSRWLISGLRSSFIPAGRNEYLWMHPSGGEFKFIHSDGSLYLANSGFEAEAIETLSGGIIVRDSKGLEWHYECGALMRIKHPVKGVYKVSTKGILITKIEAQEEGVARVLFSADYKGNRLRKLWFEGDLVAEFHWGKSFQLKSIQFANSQTFRFEYSDLLLSQIIVNNESIDVEWGYHADYRRSDSPWLLPIYLKTYGEEEYNYTISKEGYRITVTDSEIVSVTNFNPLLKEITQSTDGFKSAKYLRIEQ